MCTRDAATAPEFFLHHGFVDKIWWDWQKLSNANKFHTHFLNQAGSMTSTPYHSRDFLDLNNQPGCVCAEYVNPKNVAFKKLKAVSSWGFRAIPRLPLPKFPSKAKKLFGISESEIKSLSKLRAKIEPKHFLSKSSLRGKDATLGFKMGKKQADSSFSSKSRLEEEENNGYETEI